MAKSWLGRDENLQKPLGAQHFKPTLVEQEDPPTKPSDGALPIIEPAKMEELPAPTAKLEQTLADEIRALHMVYCFLRGLSHDARARVLKVVIMWLSENSPDQRDENRPLKQRINEDLIPGVGDGDDGAG